MRSVHPAKIVRSENNNRLQKDDLLVVEEPLEIRVGYGPSNDRKQKSIAITMRTPGHDFEIACGFLYTEGIVESMDEIKSIDYCGDVGRQEEKENVVRVELSSDLNPDLEKLERNFYMTSSCGVCGKTSIDSVKVFCNAFPPGDFKVSSEVINTLPAKLYHKQTLFEYTGGLHACGLFDLDAQVILLREDIGRHNALDKLVGASLIKNSLPLNDTILVLSGRAGFELIQKAARAGIRIVAAVGAPSSLSVSLAKDLNMTLIGFLRDNSFNIYCGEERIFD